MAFPTSDLYVSPPVSNALAYAWPLVALVCSVWRLVTGVRPRLHLVLGSYSWARRPGFWTNCLRTVRRHKSGGWVNRIGMANQGLPAALTAYRFWFSWLPWVTGRTCTVTLSLWADNHDDWTRMAAAVKSLPVPVELNLSCPNVDHDSRREAVAVFDLFKSHAPGVTVKLAPSTDKATVLQLVAAGVTRFHACNTMPMLFNGLPVGLSGPRLHTHTLRITKDVKAACPAAFVVAGGGVYSKQDGAMYLRAGASAVSTSTLWFQPWRLLTFWREWFVVPRSLP